MPFLLVFFLPHHDFLDLSSANIPSQVFPFTHPSFYLLSPCEFFTLLLPLVHDAGHWALIVCTPCGCCGMRPVGVRCVVTGVWLLTPASRLPVCLSVGSVTPDQWLHRCTHTHKHARPHMFIAALKMIPKIEVSDSAVICRPRNLHTHECNFTSWLLPLSLLVLFILKILFLMLKLYIWMFFLAYACTIFTKYIYFHTKKLLVHLRNPMQSSSRPGKTSVDLVVILSI